MTNKRPKHPHDFPEGESEGTRTINVLKPFILSLPGNDRTGDHLVNLIPKEQKFDIGEQDVHESVWSHPFIWRDYADGHIESPEQAAIRHKAASEKAERDHFEAQQQLARAQQALSRSRAVIGITDELAAELNTPVSQLRSANSGKTAGPGSGVTQTGLPHDPEIIDEVGELRQDGPTLEEFVVAGYRPENYPPEGYAARVSSTAAQAPENNSETIVPTPDVSNKAGTLDLLNAEGPNSQEAAGGSSESNGSPDSSETADVPPPPPPLEVSDDAPVARDLEQRANPGRSGRRGK